MWFQYDPILKESLFMFYSERCFVFCDAEFIIDCEMPAAAAQQRLCPNDFHKAMNHFSCELSLKSWITSEVNNRW